MYEQYYGLRERPFDLSPNPKFLFLSPRHEEALVHLRYGLTGRPGITLLVGEAGTGKTTLVKAALQAEQGPGSVIVELSNPTLKRDEFYDYLAQGFGFSFEARTSKSCFLRELELAIDRTASDGTVMALIIDEAQSLPDELLEEIRLLTNTEGRDGRVLTLVLVGQPELADRLNNASLRQLKQRIALRAELAPLDLPEVAWYIATRLNVAGGRADAIFTRDAVIAIHGRSRGIPRTVSVICDNALMTGFAAEVRPVGRDIIAEVCADFDLRETGRQAAGRPIAPKSSPAPQTVQAPPTPAQAAPAGKGVGETKAVSSPAAAPDERALFSEANPSRRFAFLRGGR
jgi:general secretion pathway protein A